MLAKNRTYQRIALFMAFLMFLSSVGFSISIGHCNMQGSDQENKSCMAMAEDGVKECLPGCCDFEQITFEGIDYEHVFVSFDDLEELGSDDFKIIIERPFVPITVPVYTSKFHNYSPPLPDWDLPVLFQSFLL